MKEFTRKGVVANQNKNKRDGKNSVCSSVVEGVTGEKRRREEPNMLFAEYLGSPQNTNCCSSLNRILPGHGVNNRIRSIGERECISFRHIFHHNKWTGYTFAP